MKIEDRIFSDRQISEEKLLMSGFEKKDGYYLYLQKLTEPFLLAVIYDGRITAKVYDTDSKEEYLNFRYQEKGAFASRIAFAVEAELQDLKEKILSDPVFIFPQTARLHEYMCSVYGKPVSPFKKSPDCLVYKDSSAKKWYSILMHVPRNKVVIDSEEDEIIEVFNLKVIPEQKDLLLKKKGIYPAYHMNKKNWISLVTDDSISDDEAILLINGSYDLVEKTKNEKKYYRRRKI